MLIKIYVYIVCTVPDLQERQRIPNGNLDGKEALHPWPRHRHQSSWLSPLWLWFLHKNHVPTSVGTQQVCAWTFSVLAGWCSTVLDRSPLKIVKREKWLYYIATSTHTAGLLFSHQSPLTSHENVKRVDGWSFDTHQHFMGLHHGRRPGVAGQHQIVDGAVWVNLPCNHFRRPSILGWCFRLLLVIGRGDVDRHVFGDGC